MEKGIKNILVAGAGTMGHGIAQCYAQAGYNVWMVARRQTSLERAAELIKGSLATLAEAGLVKKEEIPTILGRITYTSDMEAAARQADFALETIPEDKQGKIDVFAQFDKYCPDHCIVASNSTAMNIFEFVTVKHPEKFVLTHWYTPPQLVPLVDVVKGPQTNQETMDTVVAMIKGMGKEALVMNKFVPGYVIPRLQMALNREIFYLLDNDLVTPEDLDNAVKAGLALRMLVIGVVQRIDFGGLDLTAKNLRNVEVQKTLTPSDYQPKKIFDLVEKGDVGVKAGKGFYDYHGRSEAELCRERDLKIMKLLKVYEELKS